MKYFKCKQTLKRHVSTICDMEKGSDENCVNWSTIKKYQEIISVMSTTSPSLDVCKQQPQALFLTVLPQPTTETSPFFSYMT